MGYFVELSYFHLTNTINYFIITVNFGYDLSSGIYPI